MIGKRGLKPLSSTVLKEISIPNKKKIEKKQKAAKVIKKTEKKESVKPVRLNKPTIQPVIREPVSQPVVRTPVVPAPKVRLPEPAQPKPQPVQAKHYPVQRIVPKPIEKPKANLQNPFTDEEEAFPEETAEVRPKPDEKETSRSDYSNDERVPTGIPGLDEVMSGGFEKGSYNLIAGGAGSGKSIFSMQFLVTGIEKFNEPGIYVTFEEKKENVYKHMLEFGWDFAKYEKAGKFELVEYTPEQVQKMLEEGGGLIESLINKIKAKRIVIDSITAFGLLFKDELSRRQAILSLIDLMRKWNATALLTAEFEPNVEKPSSASIEFEVDSIILLYYPREGDTRKRALEILKMRGTEHSKKIFPLRIGKNGITIYPKERIF